MPIYLELCINQGVFHFSLAEFWVLLYAADLVSDRHNHLVPMWSTRLIIEKSKPNRVMVFHFQSADACRVKFFAL